MSSNLTVNYDEVKQLIDDPKVLIIDVRKPEEIQSTGRIGNSINIPVTEVDTVLKDPEVFQKQFTRLLPKPEDLIIFHCQKGARALKAHDIAVSIGFKNAKYYPGSYEEWSNKE